LTGSGPGALRARSPATPSRPNIQRQCRTLSGRAQNAAAIRSLVQPSSDRSIARARSASSPDAIELIGVLDDRSRRRIASPALLSMALGTADDLIALSRHRDIDRVLVALPHSAEQRVVEVLKKLRLMPVEISVAPDLVGWIRGVRRLAPTRHLRRRAKITAPGS
jgi:FlaA1/EpsC-like NDP-sugar epimerase